MYDKRLLPFTDFQEYPAALPLPTDSSGIPPTGSARADYASDVPYCVLIIDASPTVRRLVKVVLEQKHMLVFDFADNDQALQWLEEGVCKPHVILIDIDTPAERWFPVTHYVRSQAAYTSTTIIALSRKGGLPEQEREVRTGIRWSLTKPFSPQELLYIVQHSLPGIIYR